MDAQQLNARRAGFDALYGLEFLQIDDDLVIGRVAVRDELKQPHGLVHGGVYASIAESMASIGTAEPVGRDGFVAQGLSNATSFLRPVLEGFINARATRLHKGRSTWVWDVEFTDDQGRRCAITRMTIAVREPR